MRYFVVLFLVITFWVNVFVFVFTSSTMVPRYYITVFMFVLPVLAFYLEEVEWKFDRILVIGILSLCLCLSCGKIVLSFVTTDKNQNKEGVASFLAAEGYDFGFATYFNGNIVTELTNGKVEIANIGDPEYLEYFRWSSPMKYYEQGYHEGSTFLLLTMEEYNGYAHAKSVQKGDMVYNDGIYVVLLYDGVEELMGYAAKR